MVSNTAKEINKVSINQPLTSNHLIPTDYFQNGLLHYLSTTPNNLIFFSRDSEKGLEANFPNVPLNGGVKAVAANETKTILP